MSSAACMLSTAVFKGFNMNSTKKLFADPGVDMNMQPHCIIVGNTVTSVCTETAKDNDKCEPGKSAKLELIDTKHLSIS
ncbi:hypothetical protein KIN20_016545 [Parelaphostrongylus tenuis]|uniref:Uncharacterized protein n=1 Tax=Parelaphostrongylus tenuis TaxID=148309 RepID=A0AAD5N5D9_PARTN|nr:hypothetical protein KIN20_016545 [Parelaphostrongylus tenuis]